MLQYRAEFDAAVTFTTGPPRIAAFGTFPVRAYATVPHYEPHDHARSAGWQPARG